jgi:hypothetical protein
VLSLVFSAHKEKTVSFAFWIPSDGAFQQTAKPDAMVAVNRNSARVYRGQIKGNGTTNSIFKASSTALGKQIAGPIE